MSTRFSIQQMLRILCCDSAFATSMSTRFSIQQMLRILVLRLCICNIAVLVLPGLASPVLASHSSSSTSPYISRDTRWQDRFNSENITAAYEFLQVGWVGLDRRQMLKFTMLDWNVLILLVSVYSWIQESWIVRRTQKYASPGGSSMGDAVAAVCQGLVERRWRAPCSIRARWFYAYTYGQSNDHRKPYDTA